MARSARSRYLGLFSALALIFALATPMAAVAQGGDANFSVGLNSANVWGWEWAPDSPVAIDVDDPGTPESPDASDVTSTDVDGNFDHQLSLQVEPGFIVSVDDGLISESHVVIDLSVTGVDVAADSAAGTAPPSTNVTVAVWDPFPRDESPWREVTTDGGGDWFADFSVPGDGQGAADILAEYTVMATQADAAGNRTQWDWFIPNPTLRADPVDRAIFGDVWPPGNSVEVTLNGISLGSQPVGDDGYFWFNDVDLRAGDLITGTDGETSKEMTVEALTYTVDPVTDSVSGAADPGENWLNWVHEPHAFRSEIADGAGLFVADFSVPGDADDEQDVADIGPGTNGESDLCDAEADCTIWRWRIPNPIVRVDPQGGGIWGHEWFDVAEVSIDIDGTGIDLAPVDENGDWGTNVDPAALSAGTTVTVTAGTTVKTLVVTDLTVALVDEPADAVIGAAEPGSDVWVEIHDIDEGVWRRVTADAATGDWVADFTDPISSDAGEGSWDFAPGVYGAAYQEDGDGDTTWINWSVRTPRIGVEPRSDAIFGYEFTPSSTVDITIDGIFHSTLPTNESGDFGDGWDPAEVEVTAGMLVDVTDGVTTKTHTVTPLAITGIDIDTNVMTGTALPDHGFSIWVHDTEGYEWVVADAAGDWTVDWTAQVDLMRGSNGNSHECDDDGDCTWAGWEVPNPSFSVETPYSVWSSGEGWVEDRTVTVVVDDDDDGTNGVLFTETALVERWGPEPWEVGWNLQLEDPNAVTPGLFVTADDGVDIAKSLWVQEIEITDVDEDADTISGVAPPLARVEVNADSDGFGTHRSVDADGSGLWFADFSVPGDEDHEQDLFDIAMGTWGGAQVHDEDGDSSHRSWNIAKPVIYVTPDENTMWGNGWAANASVEVTINDGFHSTIPTDEAGDWGWDPLGDELEPLDVIDVTDGETSKSHTVTLLSVREADADTDEVAGTAAPNTAIHVWVHDSAAYRDVIADGNGDWIVDWSVPGPNPGEELVEDLVLGSNGNSQQCDDDDDCTWDFWQVPNPSFSVETPYSVWSHGEGWVEDRTVTVVVDDDDDGTNGVLFTETALVERWGPEPWEVGWNLQLEDPNAVTPGLFVTADDGVDIAKSLWVQEIEITDIDEDGDAVSGVAPPLARVEVNVNSEEFGAQRSVEADADGLWLADFANPGDEEHEQDVFDIAVDTGGSAQVFDEDGDSSHRGWYIEPPPNFFVRPNGDELWGADWFGGPEVTITIADDSGGSVLFETTAAMDDGWFEAYVGDEFDIVPGHYVVVTDGQTTKSHWVTELAITEIDVGADMVHGMAEPGTEVFVASSMQVAIWEHLTFQFGPDNRNADSLNDYPEFRRAIAHAVDRDVLLAEIPGAASAIDSYVDAYIPELSQHAWSQYPYDPAAAAALIDGLCSDLGRDCAANPPVAVLTTSSDFEDRQILADLLVPMLGAAGIELQLDLEPSEVFFGETIGAGTFDIGEWAWVGADHLPSLSEFHWWVDPQERFDSNFYNWGTADSSQINPASERMEELVGLMDVADDSGLLEAYIAEAEQILADEVVFIPLYVRTESWDEEGPHRVVEAGPDGVWTADFSVPWEDQGVVDIVFGTGGHAEQSDDDGDATHAGWQAVAPAATIEGHVYLDGDPMPDVQVFMWPDSVFTCTDAGGYFLFEGVSPVEDGLVATGPSVSEPVCGNSAFLDPDGMPLLVAGQGDLFLVDGYEYIEFNVEYAAAIQFVRVEDISGGTPAPVDDVPIRAFDRNDEEFVDVFGHDPDPADYPAILESEIAEISWIDWTGAMVDNDPGVAQVRYPYVTDVLVLAELDEVQGAQTNADEFVENSDGIVEGPEIVFQIGEVGPVVTVDDMVMYEGNRSSRVMVTFRLSEPVDGPVVVDWTTADGTATAGEDYVAASGTITFRPGRTEVVKKVQILGDTFLEDDESFEIVLLGVDGANGSDPASITLLNDDAPLPELSVEDAATSEGDRRTTSVGVTVVLSEPASGQVSFTVTTTPGTALPGEDYVDITRTVRIGPGGTSATVYLRVIGDTIVEVDEHFTVEVSNVIGATVVDPAGDVLIINDD